MKKSKALFEEYVSQVSQSQRSLEKEYTFHTNYEIYEVYSLVEVANTGSDCVILDCCCDTRCGRIFCCLGIIGVIMNNQ